MSDETTPRIKRPVTIQDAHRLADEIGQSSLAQAPGSDFPSLRLAVRVAKHGGNPDLACWRDIEQLLAAYDSLKSNPNKD
jgi:hypothetical protein